MLGIAYVLMKYVRHKDGCGFHVRDVDDRSPWLHALARWILPVGFVPALVLLLVITDFAWIALVFPMWVLLVSAFILHSDFQKRANPQRVRRQVNPGAGDSAEQDTDGHGIRKL